MAFKLKLTNSSPPPTQIPFPTALGLVRESTTPQRGEHSTHVFP